MNRAARHAPGARGAGRRAAGAVRRAFAKGGSRRTPSVAHETLVIITANNESIRYEFGRAFREHMARPGTQRRRRLALAGRRRRDRPHPRLRVRRLVRAALARGSAPALDRPRSRPASRSPVPDGAAGDVAEARRAFLASNVGARRRHRVRRRQPGVREVRGGRADRRRGHRPAPPRAVRTRAASRPSSAARRSGIATGAGSARACPASASVTTATRSARLGIAEPPTSWSAIAAPTFRGQLALADPTKSSTSGKAIEMIVQKQMADARARAEARGVTDAAALDAAAPRDGWTEAMRLLRRLGANARYFTDQSTKIPLDVASGDSAVGMCIDYYGRFQAEAAAAAGRPGQRRLRHRARRDVDQPRSDRAAARGAAPRAGDRVHRVRAVRRGSEAVELPPRRARRPGAVHAAPASDRPAPVRPGVRRVPRRPGRQPVRGRRSEFVYHRAWTGPLYGALAFVVRVMCVDPERELQDAYDALARAGFPPRRPRCSTTSRRSTTRRSRGRCGRRCSRRIRWTRRAGRSGWWRIPGPIPARDGAGAGGPMKTPADALDDRRRRRRRRAAGGAAAVAARRGRARRVRRRPRPAHVRVHRHRVPQPDLSRGPAQRARDRRAQHGDRRRASASAPRCCCTASTSRAGGCWRRWFRCR